MVFDNSLNGSSNLVYSHPLPYSFENVLLTHLMLYNPRNIYNYADKRAERLQVSQAGIWYALKRLGVTYKKTFQHP